jgi:ribose transport system ATP-binding protein
MSDVSVLSLEGVTRTFPGVLALDGVSLALRPGRVHALLGENGAGKSTLIAILSGVLTPDAGHLFLGGQPITFTSPEQARLRGIVTVYQEGDFFPDLTVAENVGLEFGWPSRFGIIDRRALRGRTDTCLRQFGSDVSPDAFASGLTAGQRQVVAVAAALSCEAAVLILDEPTSSLSKPRHRFCSTASAASATAAGPCCTSAIGWKRCSSWPTRRPYCATARGSGAGR